MSSAENEVREVHKMGAQQIESVRWTRKGTDKKVKRTCLSLQDLC